MIFRRKNDFEQFSIGGWISSRLNRMSRRLLEFTGQDGIERMDSGQSGLIQWLTLPFRIVWAFLGFLLTTWSTTRPSRAFGWALPAISVAGGFVGFLVLANNVPFRVGGIALPDPASRCEARTIALRMLGNSETDAEEKKQLLDGSLVCARHLVSIRPKNDNYKYLLGIALSDSGDELGARNIMEQIAPDTGRGVSMAHIWLANDLLDAEIEDPGHKKQRRDQAFEHLRKIEESSVDDETFEGYSARFRMALLLVADEQYDEATVLLRAVVEGQLKYPVQLSAIIQLANVYKAQEKQELLKVYVSSAIQKLTEFTLRQPDIAEIWEAMVALNVVVDDYHSAALLLRDGITATRDPDVKKKLLQMQNVLFVRQSEQVPNIDTRDNYKMKFVILAKAIVVNPTVAEVYFSLLPYLDVTRPNTDEATWLREIFLDPEAPGSILHAVVGLRDMLNGKYADGQSQWLMANRKLQTATIVINNLLQAMAEKRPEDMETIYNLASVAIETFPENYAFYYTRAKILKKLDRIGPAKQDLEIILEKIPTATEPRELMIEILEQTGDSARIERLKQEILELKAKQEADARRQLGDNK